MNKKFTEKDLEKVFIDQNGYEVIILENANGEIIPKHIHRMVAEAFIPNPDGKKHVNHIDGNKRNNCADNLEWV